MEEYIARNFNEDEYFFMWQVEPLALVGRNQLIDNEINFDYCKKHSIDILRRKSGGGCVYADMNNVMFSYITKDENVNFTFNKYLVIGQEVREEFAQYSFIFGRILSDIDCYFH